MYSSSQRRDKTRGAVSIFVVIFSALLITTVVLGFIRLMIQQQQEATSADLSRSALDSAQAGVEDAKRALVRYGDYCLGSPAAAATSECTNLTHALSNSKTCDTIQQSGIAGTPGDKEVLIKQTENDADSILQQAYTCVKIQLNTVDYVSTLPASGSRMVPLKATGDFNTVEIEWYSQDDLKDGTTNDGGQHSISLSTDLQLPKLTDWPRNRPAMLRVQLIQFGDNFQLSDFDKKDDGSSNAHTLFLNPSEVGRDTLSFADDARLSRTTGSLQQIACDKNFSTGTIDRLYACKATITLPNAVGQTNTARTAYLRINGIYNDTTSFRVSLAKDTAPVTFNSVQPVVDSTGRANDLFRRVQSRIEVDNSTFPFPQSAIDLSAGLCKTFLVTDKAADYVDGECSASNG
jgi:Tfp pilus assembly protein PilX